MYPTKEKILKRLPSIKRYALKFIKSWEGNWKLSKNSEMKKFESLQYMLKNLGNIYDKPVRVKYIRENSSAYYNTGNRTIYLNKPLSIISALHEFAHHIFGNSELQACRWSISIFSKAFPKAYDKLQWKGHMLIKRKRL